jgi:hypothetical protein
MDHVRTIQDSNGMGYEFDPSLRAITDAAKLLSDIATHPLMTQSEYLELREFARLASQQVPDLVIAVGKLKTARAPQRHDD